MRLIKTNLTLLLLPLMLLSCIKRYDPVIDKRDMHKFVVSGQVTDLEGNQMVSVSKTSPAGDPQYLPVKGCNIRIIDDKGNIFPMADALDGNYYAWIDPIYLIPGASFKVEVLTPEGISITSDYDQIAECPEVDSVYYIRKDLPTTDPTQDLKGIQIYLDLDGKNTGSHFYRWEEVETWEYHADYPLTWYYDGTLHHVTPPDYSKNICWISIPVKNIYTLSTQNLVENKYHQLPLHFVDNKTARLAYGYSLMISQFTLSEAAYVYWDQLRINSRDQGGLYQKQPLAIKGNLHNITNPGEDVLGFFGASSVKTKRISIRNVENLELDFFNLCSPTLILGGLQGTDPHDYPIYLGSPTGAPFPTHILNPECVDCTYGGGTNVKPYFWPY